MSENKNKKNTAFSAVVGFIIVTALLCLICAGSVFLASFLDKDTVEAISAASGKNYCLVIDAGHGGIDSGAVGVNGIEEKDLNLSVAKKLYELCKIAGINAVMTRTEDAMLVEDSVKKYRKMQDLKNRLIFAENTENPLFVSIHMNTFPQSRYSGMQVYYSKTDERGRSIASYIQTYNRTYLDPANSREIKPANSSIYILDRIKVPAVLIECGFISNPEECAKLCTDEYQTMMAVTIFASLVGYMGQN
jgi:N-acetylmuramoyl-L-alanine amidase